MAPEDRVEGLPSVGENLPLFKQESNDGIIPGLEDDILDPESKKKKPAKKQPYAKPIPKNFMAQWNETGMTPEGLALFYNLYIFAQKNYLDINITIILRFCRGRRSPGGLRNRISFRPHQSVNKQIYRATAGR